MAKPYIRPSINDDVVDRIKELMESDPEYREHGRTLLGFLTLEKRAAQERIWPVSGVDILSKNPEEVLREQGKLGHYVSRINNQGKLVAGVVGHVGDLYMNQDLQSGDNTVNFLRVWMPYLPCECGYPSSSQKSIPQYSLIINKFGSWKETFDRNTDGQFD
ncbi:MAG: hypothetical protein PHF67_05045 [Candidatus Nanoarchaeia archaeon]|nr:hypothetical protein [Candidatus Nanoarchaeia archaeon]